jgi:hypothetical protein
MVRSPNENVQRHFISTLAYWELTQTLKVEDLESNFWIVFKISQKDILDLQGCF